MVKAARARAGSNRPFRIVTLEIAAAFHAGYTDRVRYAMTAAQGMWK